MPPEIFEILREVVEALSQGLAITIAPHQMNSLTSEAAGILGLSRPTLVRLLEAGEIPFEQPGRHRRVRLADVLAYHECSQAAPGCRAGSDGGGRRGRRALRPA